ncbi:hypothetical protein GW17_00003912 [Ensete ventricosum]|nr:hypothetical protein GW17_00003912 [Ensete ventricosum]
MYNLQVVSRLWERNDVKGVVGAIEKMSDYSVCTFDSCLVRLQRSTCNVCNYIVQVSSDVLGCLKDKSDLVTLDICTSLLPLLTGLLESNMDRYASGSPIAHTIHYRHVGVSLGMLLNLVRIFGPVIHSTLSAGPSVGVDLQAEQRFVLDWPSFCILHLYQKRRVYCKGCTRAESRSSGCTVTG